MSPYRYFPAGQKGLIRTLMLDANVTQHLDTIARKGSNYRDPAVRARITDLIGRLDKDVVVLPGFGAVESVVRRGGLKDFKNYHRRSTNSVVLFEDGHSRIHEWLHGNLEPMEDDWGDLQEIAGIQESMFNSVRDNLIFPSYVLLLKAYMLHLSGAKWEHSFREFARFAEELWARGSREIALGTLLLAGNRLGKEVALNIMKLRQERDMESALNNIWNTSFDLTYSRLATVPALPEFRDTFALPFVFVTDDKHLGNFLDLIQPLGGFDIPAGGGLTADRVTYGHLLPEERIELVNRVIAAGNLNAALDPTLSLTISRARKYKAERYAQQLETWFHDRAPTI